MTERLELFRQKAESFAAGCSVPEAAAREKREKEMRIRAAELFSASGCPALHRSRKDLRGGEWKKVYTLLESRMDRGGIFALIGANGPGKTQLGVECIRHVTGKGRRAIYATAMEFFLEVKATFRQGAEKDERGVIGEFSKPALLVLDECQERGETEWEDRLLTHLIDRRYREERCTILISNLKREEFEASLGRSIISRLNETGGILECLWPSFRTAGD